MIQHKGIEHERAFLSALAAAGRLICDLNAFRNQTRPTLDAMRRGEEIIYQGYTARFRPAVLD